MLDKAEDHPVCNEECANVGCVGATLRFKQEKRRTSWQLCQALDGYSLSLPKVLFNRAASNLDRIENHAITKKSGCVHAICAHVRRPSQFVCCVGCARLQIAKFREVRCWSVRVREVLI